MFLCGRKNQCQAKALSKGLNIDYYAMAAKNIDFPNEAFDVITACQCFWYFNHEQTVLNFHRMLKLDGLIVILYMAWLPFEDKIAGESEKLVLKYSPNWSGSGKQSTQLRYLTATMRNLNWFIIRNIPYRIDRDVSGICTG